MQLIQKGEKRGERFGRLGSCTKSVQADKIQKGYCKNPGHFPKYSETSS
jgi:hypothetical protein